MGKILTIDTAPDEIKQITDPIILAGGCFDILHPGHIRFLNEAKKIGGVLCVLLESDEKIRILKGEKRPIHSQHDRAFVLSHLDIVDYIIKLPLLKSNASYDELVISLNPSFFAVTKDDPVIAYVLPQAQKSGAQLIEVVDRIENHASSIIIKQLNI